MLDPQKIKKSISIHKFLAQIFTAVGLMILALAYIPQLFDYKLIPIDNILGVTFFMALLIYGVGMYIVSTVYECYIDLRAAIEKK